MQTPVKDVKTPSFKKGLIFGLPPKPMPPPPPLMSKNTSTLQHSTTVQKASSMSQPPKLTWFSGENAKGELAFDLWRYTIRCLLKQQLYTESMIKEAMRTSLRGEAGRVVMRLGTYISVNEILNKLDSINGNIDQREALLSEFYGARQKEDEDITSWSCRLENVIGRAQDLGMVQVSDIDKILHSMLWTGLRQDLKDISSHTYDTIKDFDSLRVALRQIERDHAVSKETDTLKTKIKQGTSNQRSLQRNRSMINW